MFDSIVVHPNAPFRTNLDLGEIAEALLFYGRVHLLLNEGTLVELVQRVGLVTTFALVESDFAEVSLFRNGAATHSFGPPERRLHQFIVWEKGKGGAKQSRSQFDVVYESLERATGQKKRSRRAAYRFLERATVNSVDTEVPNTKSISELATLDVQDRNYLQRSIATILELLTGEPPPPSWQFDVIRTDQGLLVESNLNFEVLTKRLRSAHNTDAELSPALLLDFFNQARLDLFHAARLGSELLTSDLSGALIRHRLTASINFVSTSRIKELELFQDMVLEGRRIADALRSGHKTLDQLLRLVEKAHRFRSWLADQPPDSNLLREYYAAVTRDSWAERLPNRHLRFAIFTGIGVAIDLALPTGIGTTGGAVVGAIDAYVVDRLAGGWKPSQFVERELRAFVKPL